MTFRDRNTYDAVRRAGMLTHESGATLQRIPDSRISDFVEYDRGCAMRFTIYRDRRSGSPGDPIFRGAAIRPLLDIEVPTG